MKRTAVGLAAGLLGLSLAVGGAFGAASKPFQATVHAYKTASQATTELSKLKAKGFSGFATEIDKGSKKYEVEAAFATQKAAMTEMSKLHKAGFKGAAVENEKTEKTV